MGRSIIMKIEWQDPAKRKIQDIFDYYNLTAGARVARKITRRIVESTRILVKNPMGGQREWLLEDMPYEYRRLVEGYHKVVYRIDGDTVLIVDIWDCRRDPADLRQNITEN